MTDTRTFHWTETTGIAHCGQRLIDAQGHRHIGNSRAGLIQFAQQYPDTACQTCTGMAQRATRGEDTEIS